MSSNSRRSGLLYALAAYVTWGLAPLFWRLIRDSGAAELVAHRALWSWLFFVALLASRGWLPRLLALSWRDWALGSANGLLLVLNWWIFLYGVQVDRVVDVSLGYYINPLLSVLFGLLFLGERLSRGQWFAVVIAASGVVILALASAASPWLALALAATFALYGLLRKLSSVDPMVGSVVELLPWGLVAAAVLAWPATTPSSGSATPPALGWLLATGPVTALPVLWFAYAAARLPLSVVGFIQYLAPTIQLILAVGWFGEELRPPQATAFTLIWIALGLFSLDATRRRGPDQAESAPPNPRTARS